MGYTSVKGYTDVIGKHGLPCGDLTGPVSYPLGGVAVTAQSLGTRTVDFLVGGLTNSGSYNVVPQFVGTGLRQSAFLRWFASGAVGVGITTLTITGAGTGQTNGITTLAANTGTATIQVTIAGGLITAVKVLNAGGPYLSAPTFTVAQGGTPGTITTTLGVAGVVTEVAAGVNLSAETIRVAGVGG